MRIDFLLFVTPVDLCRPYLKLGSVVKVTSICHHPPMWWDHLLNPETPVKHSLHVTTEAQCLTTNPGHIFQVSNWRHWCVFPSSYLVYLLLLPFHGQTPECWPPYWADNWLSAALHKIAAWHRGWRKRTGWYTANPALLGSHSFPKLFSYRWHQCILMKTTCHLNNFFPELSLHSWDPSTAHNLHLRRHSLQPCHCGCLFITQQFETPSLLVSVHL